MNDRILQSMHLHVEPDRLERFRAARRQIEGSKGNNTIMLEMRDPTIDLGEVDFWSPLRQQNTAGSDSNYELSIGTKSYRLKYGSNRVGRLSDNDITVDDIYVSRRHCCIVVHSNGSAELFDTASKNSTYVNGNKTDRCWLHSGDEVDLAKKFQFKISLSKKE